MRQTCSEIVVPLIGFAFGIAAIVLQSQLKGHVKRSMEEIYGPLGVDTSTGTGSSLVLLSSLSHVSNLHFFIGFKCTIAAFAIFLADYLAGVYIGWVVKPPQSRAERDIEIPLTNFQSRGFDTSHPRNGQLPTRPSPTLPPIFSRKVAF